jgi:hypothetical protein
MTPRATRGDPAGPRGRDGACLVEPRDAVSADVGWLRRLSERVMQARLEAWAPVGAIIRIGSCDGESGAKGIVVRPCEREGRKATETPKAGSVVSTALAMSSIAALFGSPALRAAESVSPVQVVDSIGRHVRHSCQRRNHTKGTCALGEFSGTLEAVALSRSKLFTEAHVPVVAMPQTGAECEK